MVIAKMIAKVAKYPRITRNTHFNHGGRPFRSTSDSTQTPPSHAQ